MSAARRSSFVVRVVEDGRGQLTGVIECVATGAKEAFSGLEAVGGLIAGMLQRARPDPAPDGETG